MQKWRLWDLHYIGMHSTGICLGCLVSTQALEYASAVWCLHMHKDIQLLEKGQRRAVIYVTMKQLQAQITRQCYIHARKSEVVKSWLTTKTTDSPKDALQNQQWPSRHEPSKLLPSLTLTLGPEERQCLNGTSSPRLFRQPVHSTPSTVD